MNFVLLIQIFASLNLVEAATVTFHINITCTNSRPWCHKLQIREFDVNAHEHYELDEVCENEHTSQIASKYTRDFGGDGFLNNYYEFGVGIRHNCNINRESTLDSMNLSPINIHHDSEHWLTFRFPEKYLKYEKLRYGKRDLDLAVGKPSELRSE